MNILVIKHGSLGDIILSVGAIQSIRKHYKDARIYLLTQSNYINILNKFPDVDTFLEDNRGPIILSISKILGFVNNHQINLVIDLQNSSRTQFYNFFIKYFTKAKILSARKFSTYAYHQKPLGLQHITDNHQDQLSKIGINHYQISNLNWMIKKNKFNEKKPYVIFIPGASQTGDYKRWPINNYGAIANYLANKNYDIYLTGSKLDEDVINEIIKICPAAENKIEDSKIEDFYDLCLNSSLIISNDTGPAHIAGLTNKHLIWLANDNKISFSCHPLGVNVHKIKSKRVKDIDSNQVIQKIDNVLNI
ncbi:MAG: glycosyltransferase family 9 protein [Alphaproteobacteria bacterium]|tara:strand:+ start:291 stop:1208 length:918 start_codon:yes stop_codon:yes gene_type:complete